MSSSTPDSLTTSFKYLSELEVKVLHTGGRICEIHEDMVLGTFLTKTVKAGKKIEKIVKYFFFKKCLFENEGKYDYKKKQV